MEILISSGDGLQNLEKWIRIRKDLFLQMRSHVRKRLGQDTPELLRYNRAYEKEFTKKWKNVTREDLLDRIQRARIVLMGDFHALHQSQKAILRVLRQLGLQKPLVLAVEFLESDDQEKIDQFMSGRLSERDFLKAIRWQSRWGFPWEHYKPILRWAQKNKVSVYGLNKSASKKDTVSLKSRDVFAGKKISEICVRHPQALLFVVYGDLHLAQEHIPKEIISRMGSSVAKDIVRIFQNAESIYFQLIRKEMESSVDVISMSRNIFCLMSIPPWVKWQNYLMYLEETYDLGLDEDGEDEVLDYTDHVGRYVKIIAEELDLEVSLADLSVYSARDTIFWSKIKESMDVKKLRWIETLIADEISFYIPEVGIGYLSRGSVNHAASLAMQFIQAKVNGQKNLLIHFPNDFLSQIWIEAVCYFGSKMINPKRKSDTISDIKSTLTSRASGGMGKEPLQLALAQKMHELMLITGVSNHRLQTKARKRWSYVMAARLLGGMLGERLYNGYRKKLVSLPTLRSMIQKSVESDNFAVAYYGMLEIIESMPMPFKSKKEKL